MKLFFSYKPEMEYINFRAAFASINHKEMSRVQKLYYDQFKSLTKSNVKKFVRDLVKQNNISLSQRLKEIKSTWQKIEKKFFARAGKIFDYKLPQKSLNVYLSVNDRCSYNFDKGYFFVHPNPIMANKVIMHELWHWYFHFTVGQAIEKMYGRLIHNNLKESLTVLLNSEFKDLLGEGVQDLGYSQHQELRKKILSLYKKSNNIYKTIGECLKNLI